MNKRSYYEDSICARVTPSGGSAIAVIRGSGKDSWNVLKKVFKPSSKTSGFKSHRVYYGIIVDDDMIIDSVVVLTFAEGRGFTGEESFEINCHGSEVIISLIIKLLCREGMRLAEPGEFSKRAFLNGRIDLSEAEAIMDVVNAATKKAALVAVRQLSGGLRENINNVKEQLADLMAAVEVYIDYPEEDLSIDVEGWNSQIGTLINKISDLLKGFERGRMLREGTTAVLLGRTNSGKSTLFNYLLNEDKAIVSDIHGTTRDYIDGVINIEGFGIRLIDTAGLRVTDDPIEKEGTKRSKELSKTSDILLYILSGTEGLTDEDLQNINKIDNSKKILCVINKKDLINEKDITDMKDKIINNFKSDNIKFVSMSALNKEGIEEFNKKFLELMLSEKSTEINDPIITNTRHAKLLEDALNNLSNAKNILSDQILDLAAFELREALDNLGDITGEITSSDVLNRIFSSFCIGK